MALDEWAAVVDERMVRAAPTLDSALRRNGAPDPIGMPLPAGLAFEQPLWRRNGFISTWPSPWGSDRAQ